MAMDRRYRRRGNRGQTSVGSTNTNRSTSGSTTVSYQGVRIRVNWNRNGKGGSWTILDGNASNLSKPSEVDTLAGKSNWPVDPDDGGGGGADCFSGNSTVELKNGDIISIDKLKVGDKVKTINKNGTQEYSKVYAWFHKSHNDSRDDYLNIKTDNNRILSITPQHRLFVNNQDKPASSVKVDDMLGKHKVVNVKKVTEYGKYAPVTDNGFIMVDGINCSCYAFYSHNFCHRMINILFKPIVKLIPSLGSWFDNRGINKMTIPFLRNNIGGRLFATLTGEI